MTAIYNEIDPFAAEWLTTLSEEGHIARGRVDQTSVRSVSADDVRDVDQFHAFAGVGGWSLALRLAGWPDDQRVWTGSCPCQPFSQAGRRRGVDDDRHLWPAWFRLVRECRPPVVFGEQVASPDGLLWLDDVLADLEGEGYAVGAADLCAAGVGAPHLRQRLYFVAFADVQRREGKRLQLRQRAPRPSLPQAGRGRSTRELGHAHEEGRRRTGGAGGEELSRKVSEEPGRPGATREPWAPCDWIECQDGALRPVEPGAFPLAHGVPGRLGRLRAYGNAIVPKLAATFVRAAVEAYGGTSPRLNLDDAVD